MLKRLLKRACQCVGLSSLILVGNYGDLLAGGADVRMHTPFPVAGICYAQIADIFLVALLLFAILSIAARTKYYPWFRLVAAIVIPPYLIQRSQSFFPFDLIDGIVLILLVAWAAILLLLLLRFSKWYRRLLRMGSNVAAALALFAIGSIGQLLWVATWKPAPNQINAAWNSSAQPPRQHPLLVWIVFDELSYDQVFEHRDRDLNLPNFDALKAESTVFTDTQPAGDRTVKVIPSLLTGRIVDDIRYNFHNHLWVRHEDDGKWAPIDGAQTVFADADQNGWRTAAVGWYNPYCGIYSDAIQNCFWTNHDMFDGMMAQNASFASNVYTPLAQVVRELKSPARADRDICTFNVRHRYTTETDLQQQAFQLLHTDQADFIFLHLAIPHSPNIWSRIQDNYTQYCDSSYLDNLALTDHVLGQLLATLKASPRWSDTSLIVQGDHGWRVYTWYGLPSWTEEDDAASRDVFDPRPALLIHQAGQTQAQTVAKPWPIVQIHSVVEQIIHGQKPVFLSLGNHTGGIEGNTNIMGEEHIVAFPIQIAGSTNNPEDPGNSADESAQAVARKLPTLHDFFSPGGVLSRSDLTFEHRKGQHEMARAIEKAFADKRHLIVEAGTGTGKTLAYLLPALRLARERQQRVIISTGTKNLQEQLFFKDVPFLESILGPLKVCYMKGRSNYLCKHKLYALRDSPLLSGLEEISQFHAIAEWEQITVTGDRAEIDALPEASALWPKLDARGEACLGQTCPDWENCFITAMRRKALESDIIIVNHHLFFADMSIKLQAGGGSDAGVLPAAGAVIFDEAHELEETASNYFGIGLSTQRFDELARDVETMLRAKQASTSAIESATASLRDRARMFFAALPVPMDSNTGMGRMPFDQRADFLEQSGDTYTGALNALVRLEGELERLKNVEEAPGLRKRTSEIAAHLKFLLESQDPNTVFWIERRAAGGVRTLAQRGTRGVAHLSHTHLQATPIDVSQLLSSALFEQYSSVVLTSATLTVASGKTSSGETVSGFEHISKRLGLSLGRELVVPSHFNYQRQALLYLPPGMPDPREPDFFSQAAERTRRVLEISHGRAFCLFTSYSQMRAMHERLSGELPYPLLLQGSAPRNVLLEEFRDTPGAVLFGTSSFWQGVDVQGEQLSCVIIDRLPFAVPSDPVVKARMDAITAAGGSAFFDYQIPSAVITLKQGFGRLIRSLQDRGVLMLLDPRMQRQRYGRIFLDSLPPYRLTQSIEDVEAFFAV